MVPAILFSLRNVVVYKMWTVRGFGVVAMMARMATILMVRTRQGL